MTKDEGRPLQYAIGCVCRHLHKKIEEQNHEFKEELKPYLVSLLKVSDNECGVDEDWIKAQDRWIVVCERNNIMLFSFSFN